MLYTKTDKDGRAMRALLNIFIRRVRNGLLSDVLVFLPEWRTSGRMTWPCRIWALYRDNGKKDVEWFYNKFMSELRDAGLAAYDVSLTLSPYMPTDRDFLNGAVSLKEVDAEDRRTSSLRGKG